MARAESPLRGHVHDPANRDRRLGLGHLDVDLQIGSLPVSDLHATVAQGGGAEHLALRRNDERQVADRQPGDLDQAVVHLGLVGQGQALGGRLVPVDEESRALDLAPLGNAKRDPPARRELHVDRLIGVGRHSDLAPCTIGGAHEPLRDLVQLGQCDHACAVASDGFLDQRIARRQPAVVVLFEGRDRPGAPSGICDGADHRSARVIDDTQPDGTPAPQHDLERRPAYVVDAAIHDARRYAADLHVADLVAAIHDHRALEGTVGSLHLPAPSAATSAARPVQRERELGWHGPVLVADGTRHALLLRAFALRPGRGSGRVRSRRGLGLPFRLVLAARDQHRRIGIGRLRFGRTRRGCAALVLQHPQDQSAGQDRHQRCGGALHRRCRRRSAYRSSIRFCARSSESRMSSPTQAGRHAVTITANATTLTMRMRTVYRRARP